MKILSTWITAYEKSGYRRSPRYEESLAYFRQFETRTPYAKMSRMGMSPEGRPIECLIVAKGKEFTPLKAKKSGKCIVLIQNGIHAGEIEGKDACMLLLREILITKEKLHLLENLILIVIPILNVDGHERISEYNRPNQNGPEEMGWRTNSHNLNLNRDYMKAETPEVASFIKLFNHWNPDFFIDNHTTNGADYQYHISYALEKSVNIDTKLGRWGMKSLLPAVISSVESDGFLTAPYIQFKDGTIESGIVDTPALPRLSTGYTALRNRLGLLVETHSLKPYQNRVNSTLSMNTAVLSYLNDNARSLMSLNRTADSAAQKLRKLPIKFTLDNTPKPFSFKGFQSYSEESPITGNAVVRYTTEPITQEIPFYDQPVVTQTINIPKGYIIPKAFDILVQKLMLHGITVDVLKTDKVMTIEEYTFVGSTFSQRPYEGRMGADVQCSVQRKQMKFPAGTYLVRTDQSLNRVIVNLLEPEAPDSFVSWGFFNAFFERKEYAEAYVMEPIAQAMHEQNKALREQFTELLKDETFRDDPDARLDFFYRNSPYFDSREKKYPIYRMV